MKYKYYIGATYSENFEAAKSTWGRHEFVSLDKDSHVIGYIGYSVSQTENKAYSLGIVNFSDNKITFGKDVAQVIDNIFLKFNFNKLSYGVYAGNPIEATYDKLTKKYGGNIIGTMRRETKLMDGQLYDYKMYEIFKEDYVKNMRK